MEYFAKNLWKLLESMIQGILKTLFHLVGLKWTEENSSAAMQFIRFGIVGVSNTVVSYAIYVASLLLIRRGGLNTHIDIYIAQCIAFFLSVLWSYYWNNRYVFTVQKGEKRSRWKTLIKTYISYSFTGLFLNNALLFVWVNIFRISEFLAPVMNLAVSVPLNFLINKMWAFKSERDTSGDY